MASLQTGAASSFHIPALSGDSTPTFTLITLDADALSLLTAAGLTVADLEHSMLRVFGGS